MRTLGSTSGRRRRLVNCADCCSNAPDSNGPCNARLCGLTPLQIPDTCAVCDGVHADVQSCTSLATCPPNEVCFTGIRIVGTRVRFVFGCYEERVCYAMVANNNKTDSIHRPGRVIHGDQGMPICDACCKGNKCNLADCFQVRANMTLSDFNNGTITG